MPELSDLNRFAIIITGSDYAAEAREVKIMINAINLIDNIKIFMFIKCLLKQISTLLLVSLLILFF